MGARFSIRYRFGWKYHLGVGLIVLFGFFVYWYSTVRGAHPSHRSDTWISLGINVAVFYVNFLWIWPLAVVKDRLHWGRLSLIVTVNVLVLTVASLLISIGLGNLELDLEGFTLIDSLSLLDGSIRNLYPYSMPNLLSLVASFIAFIVEWIYLPFVNRDKTERKIQQARQAWRRAQLDPHLLDTHLVMLSVITRESQTKAQLALDYTIKVIQFYIGGNDPEAFIQLAEEIKCVGHLIEIQRIRYGDALSWRLEIEDNIPDIAIIPMTVMPLAENMARYAELNRADAPAVIRVQMTKGDLIITTENRIRIAQGREESGTGLSNLEERLEYAYPGKYRLTAREENSWYYVELVISGLINSL